MKQDNEKEMSSDQTTTSHNSNSEVTDVNSVPPTNDNYTTDNKNIQGTLNKFTTINNVEDTLKGINKNSSNNINNKIVIPNFYSGKNLLHNTLANFLIKHFHIIILNNKLYIYNKGVYEHNLKLIERLMVHFVPHIKPAEVKVVFNALNINAPVKSESNYRFIAFRNAIVNIEDLTPIEFNPDEFVITRRINANFDISLLDESNENFKFVKDFFYDISCGDSELERLLFEISGYSMVNTSKFQIAFMLKGSSNNGKSTYLHLIEALLGKGCGHLNLMQLSNIKFLKDLYNCTANIVDDSGQPNKVDLELLQTVISGGTITVPLKDNDKFNFRPRSTIILATTKILNFKDFNKSLTRRFKVIPFNADFNNRSNVDMIENICNINHLDVIATMAMKAFSKVIKDGHFHIPDIVEQDTKTYFYENNNVMEFVDLYPIPRLIIKGEYYTYYENWCRDNNRDKVTSSVFGKQVLALGYKSVNPSFDGIRHDYYAQADFNIMNFREEYQKHCSSSKDTSMSILDYINYLNKNLYSTR